MVVIDQRLLEAIIVHARTCLPEEGCGLLLGTVGDDDRDAATVMVRGFVPITNVARRRQTTFVLDPQQMLDAEARVEAAGDDIVGIVHSHPTSPPVPSSADRADAAVYDPSHLMVQLLVSFRDGVADVAAWRLGDGDVTEIAIGPNPD